MSSTNDLLVGISYDRTSTFDQAYGEDGFAKGDGSNEAQQHRCNIYIAQKSRIANKNLRIGEHLSDRAFSGKNTNRPAYQRMWKLIESRTINFVVTAELSRLIRSVVDFLDLVGHCEKHDVSLYIVGLDLDTSEPMGKMMITVIVALAQFERELTGTRVRENSLARLVKDGKINGATEILGLVSDVTRRGHFTTDPDGVLTAMHIMKLFLKVSSKKRVLEMAQEMGLKGPQGSELTSQLIEATLNPVNTKYRYRGQWPVNKSYLKGKSSDAGIPEVVLLPHGPVISDIKLLDAVQEKVADTKHKHKKSGTNGYVYMLSNLLQCEDGARFSGQCAKGGAYRYYFAPQKKLRVHADEIDTVIVRQLKEHFGDDKNFQNMLGKMIRERNEQLPEIEQAIRSKANEIETIDSEESALRSKVVGGNGLLNASLVEWLSKALPEMQQRRSSACAAKEKLELQRRDILDRQGVLDLRKTATTYLDRFSSLTGVQKRNFMEKIVESVIVRSDNTLEIRFLGRPEAMGVNERKKSLYYEGNGSSGRI